MALIKKYYPIKNRKDFFKYVIIKKGESLFDDNAKLHTDFQGKEMYFDSIDRAREVCNAINRVELVNRKW